MPTGFLNTGSGFGSQFGGVYDTGALKQGQDAYNASQQKQLSRQGFEQQGQLQGAQLGQQERQSQRDFALGQQGFATQTGIAGIQAQAAELPARLQQQRFGQVFPYLTQALNNFSATPVGGVGGQQPAITAGGVFSQPQVQQQVNMMRAGNDAQTAGQVRSSRQGLAGRGVGAMSPLGQALQGQYQGQNLMANTQGESQTRLGAAQANATQTLASQQAREGQFASRQQEDIQRRQTQAGSYNALLAALSGVV